MPTFPGPETFDGQPRSARILWAIQRQTELAKPVDMSGHLPTHVSIPLGEVGTGFSVNFVEGAGTDNPRLKTGMVLHPNGPAEEVGEIAFDTTATLQPGSRTLSTYVQRGFTDRVQVTIENEGDLIDKNFIWGACTAIERNRFLG